MKIQIVSALLLLVFLLFCSGKNNKNNNSNKNIHEFTNSTGILRRSGEKIDNGPTYEIFFYIINPVECISAGLETVYLQKEFPYQTITKKSYFIVEKIIEMQSYPPGMRKSYIQIGRNYNNNWDIHNPVKICGKLSDPVSGLNRGGYRIRFTTFDPMPVYFTVSIYSQSEIIFNTTEEQPVSK